MKSLKSKQLSTLNLGTPTAQRAVESLARAAQTGTVRERQLVDCARQLLRARIEMEKHIPRGLMKDSAWAMMLELFINGEEGGIVYVKQLMLACGETATSAMRLIDRLQAADLLERAPDPLDHRRVIVSLSDRGRQAMIALLEKIADLYAEREVPGEPVSFAPRR